MAVKFSIVDFGREEEKEGVFQSGHADEESLEEIESLWRMVEKTSSLDAVPVNIIHYIYTGDGEVLTRDASAEELEKLEEEAYNMYREGKVVVSGGYALELVGGRQDEIVVSKERGQYGV